MNNNNTYNIRTLLLEHVPVHMLSMYIVCSEVEFLCQLNI